MAGLGIVAKGILEKVASHLAEKKVGEAALSKASEAVGSGQAGGVGVGGGQPSPMPSSAPVSDPTAITGQLGNANTMNSLSPETSSVMSGAQINNPYLDRMTWKNTGIVPNAGQGAYRQEALRDMSEVEFNQYAKQMNASPYEYWTQQMKKDPNNAYNYLNQMFASNETPEQKAKREKSERLGRVFNDLGDVLGNAANLYYASKGGVPVDLESVNEKHRRRMQKIKEKQEALDEQRKQIIMNAKLGDIKNTRETAAAQAKAEREAREKQLERNWKTKHDMLMKQLDDMYKTGQINAENKAKIEQMAFKAESDKDLENLKGELDRKLKGTASYSDKLKENQIVDTLMGDDGNVYGRNIKFNDGELAAMAMASPMSDSEEFREMFRDKKTKEVDYAEMGRWLAATQNIPSEYIIQMGGKVKNGTKKPDRKLPEGRFVPGTNHNKSSADGKEEARKVPKTYGKKQGYSFDNKQ